MVLDLTLPHPLNVFSTPPQWKSCRSLAQSLPRPNKLLFTALLPFKGVQTWTPAAQVTTDHSWSVHTIRCWCEPRPGMTQVRADTWSNGWNARVHILSGGCEPPSRELSVSFLHKYSCVRTVLEKNGKKISVATEGELVWFKKFFPLLNFLEWSFFRSMFWFWVKASGLNLGLVPFLNILWGTRISLGLIRFHAAFFALCLLEWLRLKYEHF